MTSSEIVDDVTIGMLDLENLYIPHMKAALLEIKMWIFWYRFLRVMTSSEKIDSVTIGLHDPENLPAPYEGSTIKN